eukprot:GEMP01057023.1.p1 GENE.GEMP01057023.1~~GEMP01057023.1.p1  ORF type:complete len:177 (+),score=39.39 GEMP01057023.1:212-742(+)
MGEFVEKNGRCVAEFDFDVRSSLGGVPPLIALAQMSEDRMSVCSGESILRDRNIDVLMENNTGVGLCTPIMKKKHRKSTCPGVIRRPKNRAAIARRNPLSPYDPLYIREQSPRRRSSCSSGIPRAASPLEGFRKPPPLFTPKAAKVVESAMDMEQPPICSETPSPSKTNTSEKVDQ